MGAAFVPIMTAASVATTAAGAYLQYKGQREVAKQQQNIAVQEQQAEEQRRRAMELDARRRTREIIRNRQRASALSQATAVSQGAQLGTGVQGAQGQISGQTGTNLAGVFGNLEIGRNLFDINAQISGSRFAMASAGGTLALGQGLSSLGGAMIGVLPEVRSLSGGFNPGPYTMLTGYGPGAAGPNRIVGGHYFG